MNADIMNMKYFKMMIIMAGALLFLCSSTLEAGEPKRISPWYRHSKMPCYADLAPYRQWIDMVSQAGPESISSKAFVDSCHAGGIKVWRTVPNAAENKFKATDFHDAGLVNDYIDYLLELCRTMGYDGIDLDFESLPEEYRAPYTAFVSALGRKLHARGLKLGQCIPAGDYVKFLDADTLDHYCDQIRVMGYDAYYAGGPISTPMGPTSPRWWVKQQTESKWIKGFTKEKIVWGLPAYSNFYQVPHLPDNIGDGTHRGAYYRPQNVEPVWLPNDGVNFYVWGGASSYYLWATDARSTREQLALMDAAGIRHISFWYVQLITPEMWEVINEWIEK
jgi:spore germination protein YaaH